MKEQLHTIPVSEAFEQAGECPFCYIERKTEDHVMDFVLGHGASYMESDIREMTDQTGFCRAHFKKMFDYGNALGNAWILKTHYRKTIDEMNRKFAKFRPGSGAKKSGFFRKADASTSSNSICQWIQKKEDSCFICDSVRRTFTDYMDTFFRMYKKEPSLRETVKNSKGFCLTHFGMLCEAADSSLTGSDLTGFYDTVLPLMQHNMERLYEDVAWFVEKYDYRNKDADWKTSKDAIQRGMQKLKGGDPSLPPHEYKK